MPDHQKNTALLLLAAGASARLGSPKQLVRINGKHLLENMVEAALATPFRPVVVVLGAYSEKIKPTIAHLPVHILQNENWECGMGSTIACGVEHIASNFPAVSGVVVMLTDQLYVTPYILQKLPIAAWEKQVHIAAAKYEDTIGPPAYFDKTIFGALKKMDGKKGAKILLEKNRSKLAIVQFPAGKYDLDTPEDFQEIKKLASIKGHYT